MQISTKKVTKKKFIDAINTATTVIHRLHPRTRLAYYCEEFLEINEKTIKSYQKDYKKLTDPFNREKKKSLIDNAVEKDGVLVMNGDRYCFDKKGEAAYSIINDSITDRMNEAIEPFLEEELTVKCIVSPLDLPKEISVENEKLLNGFAFQNKNTFKEKIEVSK